VQVQDLSRTRFGIEATGDRHPIFNRIMVRLQLPPIPLFLSKPGLSGLRPSMRWAEPSAFSRPLEGLVPRGRSVKQSGPGVAQQRSSAFTSRRLWGQHLPPGIFLVERIGIPRSLISFLPVVRFHPLQPLPLHSSKGERSPDKRKTGERYLVKGPF
jgi:hypothetical protein